MTFPPWQNEAPEAVAVNAKIELPTFSMLAIILPVLVLIPQTLHILSAWRKYQTSFEAAVPVTGLIIIVRSKMSSCT
ncbi:MAG: hypothetical protein V9H26_12980 [Verrucomicrobiota bacterium]